MQRKTYVIGHKNPDTDSVVSAAAYARLKQLKGHDNCIAARAGKISPQTEYIFTRFGVTLPKFLPDLIPKAQHYISDAPTTINKDESVWNSLEVLQKEDSKVLPIVDSDGNYRSMFHYRAFAQYIIENINPHKKSAFSISLNHLAATIRAQPVTLYDAEEIKKSPIVVAASFGANFKHNIQAEGIENVIVLVGDRWDIVEHCIDLKVRAVILTSGYILPKKLGEMAEKKQVTVLLSPFDTSSTAMLIVYSVAVGNLGDTTVPAVKLNDTVRSFRDAISHAPSRSLPVLNNEGKVEGLIFEGNLAKEPNVEVILVDHNELSQAVEGLENFRIAEIIDHHRLGSLSTRYPITFINRVVGATCTIITNLYREQKIPLEKKFASILLCGILADTLILQSATTTHVDEEAADYLSSITGLDIKELGSDIISASNKLSALSAAEIISMDVKEYTEKEMAFTVAQIEVDNTGVLMDRSKEIAEAMEKARSEKDYLFTSLLVTDVIRLDSLLFVSGEKAFNSLVTFPSVADGIFELKGVVSRKKQLLPLLAEIVEKYTASHGSASQSAASQSAASQSAASQSAPPR